MHNSIINCFIMEFKKYLNYIQNFKKKGYLRIVSYFYKR